MERERRGGFGWEEGIGGERDEGKKGIPFLLHCASRSGFCGVWPFLRDA